MRARFVAAARLEYLAEIVYYAEAEPGLGHRFAQAVEDAIARALLFPRAGSPSPAGTRRVLLKGFPFSVYYRPEAEGIVVFAVAHQARRPGYWRSRMRER
jgi:plasmid stabilization system protein ParE